MQEIYTVEKINSLDSDKYVYVNSGDNITQIEKGRLLIDYMKKSDLSNIYQKLNNLENKVDSIFNGDTVRY